MEIGDRVWYRIKKFSHTALGRVVAIRRDGRRGDWYQIKCEERGALIFCRIGSLQKYEE